MRSPGSRTLSSCRAGIALFGLHQISSGDGALHARQLVPLSSTRYLLGDDIDAYTAFMRSGGPPPDGIPSIDDPVFVEASAARLHGGDEVIGFVHNGEARAYPQRIMVYHEIANDTVGGLNVAITYCPLTATAQGYIYARPDGDAAIVPAEGDTYRLRGETYRAGELPLEPLVSVEAFYFAWHAFYPDSES